MSDKQPIDAIQQIVARMSDQIEDLYGINHITRQEVMDTIEEEMAPYITALEQQLADAEARLARADVVVDAAKAWQKNMSGLAVMVALSDALDKFDAEAGKGAG